MYDVEFSDTEVAPGESFTVRIESKNWGGPGGQFSTIAASSPSLDSYGDEEYLRVADTDLPNTAKRGRGDTIYTDSGDAVTAEYALAEASVDERWRESAQHSLTVEFTPQETGTFVVYVRSTLTDDANTDAHFTTPSQSSYTDQQDYAVRRYEIDVTAPSESLTVQPGDEDEGYISAERLSDGETEIRTMDDADSNCCIELGDSFISPGEYRVDTYSDDHWHYEYWGYKRVSVSEGEDEFTNIPRGMVYMSAGSITDPRPNSGQTRFAPGETIPVEMTLQQPRYGGDVRIEAFVHQAGTTPDADQPTDSLEYGSVGGSTDQLTWSLEAPTREGDYEVSFLVYTYVSEFGQYSVTDSVDDLDAFTVASFEPPEITDATPGQEGIATGTTEPVEFELAVQDEDTPSRSLDVSWEVDEQRVASGTRFQFEPQRVTQTEVDVTAIVDDGSDRTRSARRSWTVSILQPPTIDSRNPSADTLTVGDSARELSVEASDADTARSQLEYTWNSDGERLGTGSDLRLTTEVLPPGQHTVTIRVTDGSDSTAPATASWRVNIAEPPQIETVTPNTDTVGVGASSTKTFSVEATDTDTPSSALTHTWELDGEVVGTGPTLEFDADQVDPGEKQLQLTITDGTSETPDAVRTWDLIVISPPQITTLEPSDANGVPGNPVEFAVDSQDPNGYEITDTEWSIRGQTQRGETITHTFTSPGNYEATVAVTNARGVTQTKTIDVEITAAPPRIESLTPGGTEVVAGDTVEFAIETVDPADRDLDVAYEWRIDGNPILTTQTGEHRFTEIGDHRVQVVAENEFGVETTREFTVTVANDDPSVTLLDGVTDEVTAESESPARVRAQVANADESTTRVQFVLDDEVVDERRLGANSRTVAFERTFADPGTRTLEIIAEDGAGGQTTREVTLEITSQRPEFVTTAPDEEEISVLSGTTLDFSAEAIDPEGFDVSYRWLLNESRTGTGPSLTHTFGQNGEYTVVAEATDPQGVTAARPWTISVDSFRVAPEIQDQSTNPQVDLNQSSTLLTLSMRNPEANDRTMRVEFVMETPDGVEIQAVEDVQSSDRSQLAGVSELQPGQQASMGLQAVLVDENLRGETLSFDYTVRYYPLTQPADVTEVDNGQIVVGVEEPATVTAGSQPGFGEPAAIGTIAVVALWVRRQKSR